MSLSHWNLVEPSLNLWQTVLSHWDTQFLSIFVWPFNFPCWRWSRVWLYLLLQFWLLDHIFCCWAWRLTNWNDCLAFRSILLTSLQRFSRRQLWDFVGSAWWLRLADATLWAPGSISLVFYSGKWVKVILHTFFPIWCDQYKVEFGRRRPLFG